MKLGSEVLSQGVLFWFGSYPKHLQDYKHLKFFLSASHLVFYQHITMSLCWYKFKSFNFGHFSNFLDIQECVWKLTVSAFRCMFYCVNWVSSHLVQFNFAGGMYSKRDIKLHGLISFIFQLFLMFRSAFKSWQSLLLDVCFILSIGLVSILFDSI